MADHELAGVVRGRSGGTLPGVAPASSYPTSDGIEVLIAGNADSVFARLAELMGRPELATDERFADHESLAANGADAVAVLREVFASATLAEWRDRLADFTGQWAAVQHTLEAVADPQAVANGYVLDAATADGTPYKMVTTPVQYDGEPSPPRRAPEFNEHGDAILAELGLDWDTVVDLKVRGIVA